MNGGFCYTPMVRNTIKLIEFIRSHPCYTHPVFYHWSIANPPVEVVGACFHQIQRFCAATREGWYFPQALGTFGRRRESEILQEIVDSEMSHGVSLAIMAGYVLNCSAGSEICSDIHDQALVESQLKGYSDVLFGHLPGYNAIEGLTLETQKAIAVFDRRKFADDESTFFNLGVALALEIISNNQLIPGLKHCLIDSGLYHTDIDSPEMHYLKQHWGESGAEQQHEDGIIKAVSSIVNSNNFHLIFEGIDVFLSSLVELWNLLDSLLLQTVNQAVQASEPKPNCSTNT